MSKSRNGVKKTLMTDGQVVETWQRCVTRMNAVGKDQGGSIWGWMMLAIAAGVVVVALANLTDQPVAWFAMIFPALFVLMAIICATELHGGAKAAEELASSGIIGAEVIQLEGETKQVRIAVADQMGRKYYVDAPLDTHLLDGTADASLARKVPGFKQVTWGFPRELEVGAIVCYRHKGGEYLAQIDAKFVAGEWEPIPYSGDGKHTVEEDAAALIQRLAVSAGLVELLRCGTVPSDHEFRKMLNDANGSPDRPLAPQAWIYTMTRAHLTLERAQ